jgi:hypothetical protein
MKRISLLLVAFLVSLSFIYANENTQTIRGQVVDKITRMPLPGATVFIPESNPIKGTVTDPEGYFTLEAVPTGRISLQINFLGYRPVYLENLNVISGKELVINVEMEENVIEGKEIVVKAHVDKTKPLNKMSTTSARTFSVEESQRYAGARNDVARMASNYAGVGTANDASNDIVIRGNSPDGLLWRLEGVTIPNPNHFGFMGATGGPVSMLNNNVLANSDFMTGAFPADYGNAMSGVFDLRLRNGNWEKYEFLGQVGFNGFEFGAEGPISKMNHSSFLINYRYSTLALLNKIGLEFGTGTAVPLYQDLVFKVNVPTKKAGKFELVGFGGASAINFTRSEMDSADLNKGLYNYENLDIYSKARSGSLILSHNYPINDRTYTRVSLAATGIMNSNIADSVSTETNTPVPFSRNHMSNVNMILSAYLNSKINRKNSIKVGFELTNMGFNLHDSTLIAAEERFLTTFESKGSDWLYQGSLLWQHKMNDYFVLNAGLHYQRFAIGGSQVVEPRIGLRWEFAENSSFSLAYGLHSMMVPIYTYMVEVETDEGNVSLPNKNLDFMKSHHVVVGFDQKFAGSWRLKTEAYYQNIYDAVIERGKESSFSMLNKSWSNYYITDSLTNGGKGRNIGLELTVEKFLDNGYYCLFTASLFDSKYAGSDGKWRSTAFDSDYILNLLGGKEIQIKKSGKKTKSDKWLILDGRVSLAGGQRYTPVDVEESFEHQQTVYKNDLAFSEKFNDYFRADIRIAFRMDHKHFSQEWAFDIQNVTNRRNPLYMQYNSATENVECIYQLGFMPMMQYRIVF